MFLMSRAIGFLLVELIAHSFADNFTDISVNTTLFSENATEIGALTNMWRKITGLFGRKREIFYPILLSQREREEPSSEAIGTVFEREISEDVSNTTNFEILFNSTKNSTISLEVTTQPGVLKNIWNKITNTFSRRQIGNPESSQSERRLNKRSRNVRIRKTSSQKKRAKLENLGRKKRVGKYKDQKILKRLFRTAGRSSNIKAESPLVLNVKNPLSLKMKRSKLTRIKKRKSLRKKSFKTNNTFSSTNAIITFVPTELPNLDTFLNNTDSIKTNSSSNARQDEVREDVDIEKKIIQVMSLDQKGGVNVHEVMETKKENTLSETKDENIPANATGIKELLQLSKNLITFAVPIKDETTTLQAPSIYTTSEITPSSTLVTKIPPRSKVYKTSTSFVESISRANNSHAVIEQTIGTTAVPKEDTDQNRIEVIEKLRKVLSRMKQNDILRAISPLEHKSDGASLRIQIKNSSLVLIVTLPFESDDSTDAGEKVKSALSKKRSVREERAFTQIRKRRKIDFPRRSKAIPKQTTISSIDDLLDFPKLFKRDNLNFTSMKSDILDYGSFTSTTEMDFNTDTIETKELDEIRDVRKLMKILSKTDDGQVDVKNLDDSVKQSTKTEVKDEIITQPMTQASELTTAQDEMDTKDLVDKIKYRFSLMKEKDIFRVITPFVFSYDAGYFKMDTENSSLVLTVILPLEEAVETDEKDTSTPYRKARHGHIVHSHGNAHDEGHYRATPADEGIFMDYEEDVVTA